ncbi:hypothetical protein CC78DRAFT_431358, partial [Lojkania enalia]
ASQARPKRHVAARACDRCRTNRIKCDDNQPCKHCRTRGLECCKGRPSERTDRPTTLEYPLVTAAAAGAPSCFPCESVALSSTVMAGDIETLRSRVSELEAQLQKRNSIELPPSSLPSPPDSVDANGVAQRPGRRQWQGFWKAPAHGQQEQYYYGPTSLDFFVHRLGNHLESNKHQPQLSDALQIAASLDQVPPARGDHHQMQPFTRRQEENLLSLFWQSYHSIFPILDENELRTHYNALWAADSATRKPSVLVDIILALCMQYSTAAIASGAIMVDIEPSHSGWEGRSLFDRCQETLQNQIIEPSIPALQCYIYSTIYLVNASSFTMAHAALSSAANVAHALGINHEPPEDMSDSRRSLYRRLWWSLYHLDSLLGLTLGRPYTVHSAESTLDASEPDPSSAPISTSNAAFYEGVNWSSYHYQAIRLLATIRTVAVLLSSKCNEAMAANNSSSIYSNSTQLETIASFLRQSVISLQDWVNEVPSPLRLRRKENGEPFSAAKCQIEFDTFAPLWLQRQRVLLELLYHTTLQYLYRTFIQFPSADNGSESLGPAIATTSDTNAVSALNHAMATINIVHQTLTETDLLNSWHRAYQYLWEATLTVIGYTQARPLCPFTTAAHQTLVIAIQALDLLASNGITAAGIAAQLTRELNA